MRLLLDAHAIIWAVDDPTRLGPGALAAIQDSTNDLLIGAGTLWEISIKAGLGKLKLSPEFPEWISAAAKSLGATLLPITVEHCAAQLRLPLQHRDPFDRLLACQAPVEEATLVSADPIFKEYEVTVVW